MYDKWKKKLIKNKIQTLEQIKSSKTNGDLIKIISEIKEIYESIDKEPDSFWDYTCEELFTDNFRLMSEYDFLWDKFSDFSIFHNYLTEYPSEELRTNFSNREILDLTYDFYKNATDKEIFSTFENLFNKKNIRIFRHSNAHFSADTLYLPYYKEIFTQIKPSGDVTDLSNMVHEFGHGIHLFNNYNQNIYKMNKILLEVVSTFFEDICLYYYGNNGEFKDAAKIGLIELFELCKEDIMTVNEIINIYRSLNIDSNTDKKIVDYRIHKFLDDKNTQDVVRCLLIENPHISASYIIAKLISIELFNIYLNDPDRAFYLLKKIMMIDLRKNLKDYYQEIIDLGLIPGNSTLAYNNYLKKELVRIKK